MTRSEFYEKIRQYESKWGKLGESNSIVHSAPETKEEPVSCTEEYKQFRKKVAEGRKKDRLIHTTVISPEDLNARYRQELFDNNVLIHTDINKYYRKVDLGNGNWRYFYSKEEYDAYVDNKNKQGASTDNAKGKGREYQKWLDQQEQNRKAEKTKETAEKAAADRGAKEGAKVKQEKEIKKNADYDKNKDLMRFNSKWQIGDHIFNDKERHYRNAGSSRVGDYDDITNNFLNQIDIDGKAPLDFYTSDVIANSMYNNKSDDYKTVVSTLNKCLDLYDREIDKFTKHVEDTYGKDSKEAKEILDNAKKLNEYTKETYESFVNDYPTWQKNFINRYYSDIITKGIHQNVSDFELFKKCGYDKDVFLNELKKAIKEKHPEADDNFIKEILNVASKGCDVTLEKLNKSK